jgi:hypothetical protein
MAARIWTMLVVPALVAGSSCGGLGDANDWLTAGCPTHASISQGILSDGSTAFVVANGIISRTLVANKSTGLLCTTSIAVLSPFTEKSNTAWPAPETAFNVNGVDLIVGGPGAYNLSDTRPRAKFVGMRSSVDSMKAGGFHWVPGARGSNPNTAWPPKGVHVEFDHAAKCSDVNAGATGVVLTTTVLELYDQTSSFGRRVKLDHNCSSPLFVFNMSICMLSVARDRDITWRQDAAVATGRRVHDPYVGIDGRHWMYASIGYLAPAMLANYGPGLSKWKVSFFFVSMSVCILSLVVLFLLCNAHVVVLFL